MKHYLVLCYESRETQAPSKKVVLHKDQLESTIPDLLLDVAYIVVEPLSSFD